MHIELLEIAVQKAALASARFVTWVSVWGPSDRVSCYVGDSFIGRLTDKPFGRQFGPLLGLSVEHEIAESSQLIHVVELILSASDVWAVWCEPDIDQRPLRWFSSSPKEVASFLQGLFSNIQSGNPSEFTSFVAHHGLIPSPT